MEGEHSQQLPMHLCPIICLGLLAQLWTPHRYEGSWAARGSTAGINFDPREFEECIAECTRIAVNEVYIKISLIEDHLKLFWWDNVLVHIPGHHKQYTSHGQGHCWCRICWQGWEAIAVKTKALEPGVCGKAGPGTESGHCCERVSKGDISGHGKKVTK